MEAVQSAGLGLENSGVKAVGQFKLKKIKNSVPWSQ